jgi:hypothetical protein
MRSLVQATMYANDNIEALCQELRDYKATGRIRETLQTLIGMCDSPSMPISEGIFRAQEIIYTAAVEALSEKA